MKLAPPIEGYLTGAKPSHSPRAALAKHITFLQQDAVERLLTASGHLLDNRHTPKALAEGLVDTCDGKALWNLKVTKKTLLELSRRASAPKPAAKPMAPPPPIRQNANGPVFTDLENIGTYFGVGKNRIGTWLDELGLRGYKPIELNESGDVDMLDVANASKEKFRLKIPTEKALAQGYAQMEVVAYRGKGGAEKSFEKYSWDRDRIKALLVKAGHPLDTERKLLNKGKGRNGNVQVVTIESRAQEMYDEWKKLYSNPSTRARSWDMFNGKPTPVLVAVEKLMTRPRYLQDKLYLKGK